jgi:hypothetical protein
MPEPMSKQILRNLTLLVLLLIGGGWLMHKFYVSLTEVRYNPATERIEVSMRIFPDDLDRALLQKTGIHTQLATELEPPGADSILMDYLLESFYIVVNGEAAPLHYLGKEQEADAIWCYLESEKIAQPVTLKVYQKLLTERFDEQVNIVQVYQGKWNKGLLLNSQERSGELTIGE